MRVLVAVILVGAVLGALSFFTRGAFDLVRPAAARAVSAAFAPPAA